MTAPPTPSSLPTVPELLPEGTVVGRHRIDTKLRDGGMAVVYIGEHVETEARVAIKILRNEFARSPEFVARFDREAKVMGRLSGCPQIVSVRDVGSLADGRRYIVMDFVRGTDLDDLLLELRSNDEMIALDRACALIKDVASGLDAAHRKSVVHRDIKPSNILIEQTRAGETAKLVDFGVSADLGGTGRRADLTATGTVIGTPEYMAPEQAAGISAVPSVDIYSMGVVLFEMLTGQKPPPRGWRTQRLPELAQHRKDVPADLRKLVYGMLEFDCTTRIQTAGEVEQRLAAVLDGFTNPVAQLRAWADRSRPQAAAGSLQVEVDAPVAVPGPSVVVSPGRVHPQACAAPTAGQTMPAPGSAPAVHEARASMPRASAGQTMPAPGSASAAHQARASMPRASAGQTMPAPGSSPVPARAAAASAAGQTMPAPGSAPAQHPTPARAAAPPAAGQTMPAPSASSTASAQNTTQRSTHQRSPLTGPAHRPVTPPASQVGSFVAPNTVPPVSLPTHMPPCIAEPASGSFATSSGQHAAYNPQSGQHALAESGSVAVAPEAVRQREPGPRSWALAGIALVLVGMLAGVGFAVWPKGANEAPSRAKPSTNLASINAAVPLEAANAIADSPERDAKVAEPASLETDSNEHAARGQPADVPPREVPGEILPPQPGLEDHNEVAPPMASASGNGAAAENAVVAEPTIDEPTIDEPIIDEPIIDEPIIDEPVADKPVAKPPRKRARPRKPKTRKPRTSRPSTAPSGSNTAGKSCDEIRAQVQRAVKDGEWKTVLSASKKQGCWKTRLTKRRRYRVQAFLELGQWKKCVKTGKGSRDPIVLNMIHFCDKKAN